MGLSLLELCVSLLRIEKEDSPLMKYPKYWKFSCIGMVVGLAFIYCTATATATAKPYYNQYEPALEPPAIAFELKLADDQVKTEVNDELKATEPDVLKSTEPDVLKSTEPAAIKKAPLKIVKSEAAAPENIIKGRAFTRMISVKATAYTASATENGIWGAFDYLGNPLKLGTIAVDFNVIPLGSTVYITGYSFKGLPAAGMIVKATDEGSAVKGKRIDIFLPLSQQDAAEFGMQDVKVYILK